MADIDTQRTLYEIFVNVNKESFTNISKFRTEAAAAEKQMAKLGTEITKLAKEIDKLGSKSKKTDADEKELQNLRQRLLLLKKEYDLKQDIATQSERMAKSMESQQRSAIEVADRLRAAYERLRETGASPAGDIRGRTVSQYEKTLREGTDTAKVNAAKERAIELEAKINKQIAERESLVKKAAAEEKRQAADAAKQAAQKAAKEKELQAIRTAAARQAAAEQAAEQKRLGEIDKQYDKLNSSLNDLKAAHDKGVLSGSDVSESARQYNDLLQKARDFRQAAISGKDSLDKIKRDAAAINKDITKATSEQTRSTAKVLAKETSDAKAVARLRERLETDLAQLRFTSQVSAMRKLTQYEMLLKNGRFKNEKELIDKIAEYKKRVEKGESGKDIGDKFGVFSGIVKGAVVGRVVREIFDAFARLKDVYIDLVRTAFEFNVQLQESQFGLAAVISQTNEIAINGKKVDDLGQKFAAAMTLAKDVQRDMLVVANESVITYTELNDVMVQGSALLSARGIALEDQVRLTAQILTAEKAVGVQQQQMFIEMRQLLSGDILRGQLARQLVAAGKVSVDQLRNLAGKDLLKVLTEALREFEIAGLRRMESLSGKWEVFTDTMRFQLAAIFDNPELKNSVLALMNELQSKFFKTVTIRNREFVVLTEDGRKLIDVLRNLSTAIAKISSSLLEFVNVGALDAFAKYTVTVTSLTVALTGLSIVFSTIISMSKALTITTGKSAAIMFALIAAISLLSYYFTDKFLSSLTQVDKVMIDVNGTAMELNKNSIEMVKKLTARGQELRKYYNDFIELNEKLRKGEKLSATEKERMQKAVSELNKDMPTLIDNTGDYTKLVNANNLALDNQIVKLETLNDRAREYITTLSATVTAEKHLAETELLGARAAKVYADKSKELYDSITGLDSPLVDVVKAFSNLYGFGAGIDIFENAKSDVAVKAVNQLVSTSIASNGRLFKSSEAQFQKWNSAVKKGTADAVTTVKANLYAVLKELDDKYDTLDATQKKAADKVFATYARLKNLGETARLAGIDLNQPTEKYIENIDSLQEHLHGLEAKYTRLKEAEKQFGSVQIDTKTRGGQVAAVLDDEAFSLSNAYHKASLFSEVLKDMYESRKKFNEVSRAKLQTAEFETLIADLERYRRLMSLTTDEKIKKEYADLISVAESQIDELVRAAQDEAQASFASVWNVFAENIKKRSPELYDLVKSSISKGASALYEESYEQNIKALKEEEKKLSIELAQAQSNIYKMSKQQTIDPKEMAALRNKEISAAKALNDKEKEIALAIANRADTSKDIAKEAKDTIKDVEKEIEIRRRVNEQIDAALQKIKEYQTESGAIKPSINIQADAEAALETFNRRMQELDSEAERAEAEFNIGTRTAESLGRKLEEIRTYKIMLYKELLADLRRFQALVLNVLAVLPPGSPLATGLMTLFNGLSVEINKAEKETAEYLGVTLSLGRGLMGVFNEVLNVISSLGVAIPEQISTIYNGISTLMNMQEQLQSGKVKIGGKTVTGFTDVFSKMFSGGIGTLLQGAMTAIPMVGAFASVFTGLFSGLKSLFTKAAKEIAKEIRNEMSEIMNAYRNQETTLVRTLTELQQKREEAIRRLSGKKGGSKELAELLPELDRAIRDLQNEQKRIFEAFEKKLNLLKIEEFKRDTKQAFDEIIASYNEYINAGGDVAKANEFIQLSFAELRSKLQKDLDEELRDYNENLQKELESWTRGAEDELGRLISKEQRAAMDIADLRKKYAEDHKNRLEDIKQAEDDLYQFILDKEEEIEGIKNEGIAERRKSTIQDKLDRIAAIQDEIQEQRTATQERIAQIKDEDEAARQKMENDIIRINNVLERERQAHEERMQDIQTEGLEKIAQMQQELDYLDEMLSRWREIAEAANSVTDAIREWNEEYSASSNPFTRDDTPEPSISINDATYPNMLQSGSIANNVFNVDVSISGTNLTADDVETAVYDALSKARRMVF